MNIRSYQGYSQPYNGLADDLLAAGRQFLAAQAAPVIQQIVPTQPAPIAQPVPISEPAPVSRMLTQATAPAAPPAGLTPAAMVGLAALAYWLFFKK
jgi:hypothetical protein